MNFQLNKMVALTGFSLLLLVGCGGQSLDGSPKGTLSETQITSPENLDGLVTAAYSYIGNDHYTAPNFLWPTGDLRAGDAHKGGNGPGDIFAYHALSVYNLVIPDMASYPPDFIDLNNKKWVRDYTGISRANTALKALESVSVSDFPQRDIRIAEMRFVRGFFYFDLKIHFKHIPYVDETMTSEQIKQASNVDFTDQQLWDKIAADFRSAADVLPLQQAQIGRANQVSAKAFLAKVELFQAYEQDDQNQVVSINQAKLNDVVNLVDEIEQTGL